MLLEPRDRVAEEEANGVVVEQCLGGSLVVERDAAFLEDRLDRLQASAQHPSGVARPDEREDVGTTRPQQRGREDEGRVVGCLEEELEHDVRAVVRWRRAFARRV